MNKTQLAQRVADNAGISKQTAERLVNTVFDVMTDALQSGRRIEIRGLGSFHVREYEGYEGHNPRTGAAIVVRPKLLPVFTPGKEMKERLNPEK